MNVFEWMAKQATEPGAPESAAPTGPIKPTGKKRLAPGETRKCYTCGTPIEFAWTGYSRMMFNLDELGTPHFCRMGAPLSADEFDVVTE
jgi:hypothetical protein